MAGADETTDAQPEGPEPCTACRATGRVLAKRGDDMVDLPCPWCDGTGQRIPERDAQAEAQFPGA